MSFRKWKFNLSGSEFQELRIRVSGIQDLSFKKWELVLTGSELTTIS